MSPFLLSQILVGVAFICDLVSFQFRDRRSILACLIAATSLLAAHYFLLDNPSAGFLMLVGVLRFSVAYFSKDPRWIWVFVGIALCVLLATYQTLVNGLAFVALVLVSIASFQATDKKLRVWMMSGTSVWLLHNILIGSPAAVILEAFLLGSNLTGYWRYYLKKAR